MTDDGRLAALVTGGGNGIGRSIAIRLAADGFDVGVADLRLEAARAVAGEVEARGTSAVAIEGDVSRRDDARRYVDEIVSAFGRLDVLVNCAGLQHVASVAEFDEDKWDLLIGVMLTGPFLCSKYSIGHLLASPRGTIVNVSSFHGKVASPYKSAYNAAKHGVIGFTRTLALELADEGVTVNAICPGYTRTPLVEGQIADQARIHGIAPERVIQDIMLAPGGMKRLAEPEEIAGLCSYLAGPDARFVTGAALSIDGGWTAR